MLIYALRSYDVLELWRKDAGMHLRSTHESLLWWKLLSLLGTVDKHERTFCRKLHNVWSMIRNPYWMNPISEGTSRHCEAESFFLQVMKSWGLLIRLHEKGSLKSWSNSKKSISEVSQPEGLQLSCFCHLSTRASTFCHILPVSTGNKFPFPTQCPI